MWGHLGDRHVQESMEIDTLVPPNPYPDFEACRSYEGYCRSLRKVPKPKSRQEESKSKEEELDKWLLSLQRWFILVQSSFFSWKIELLFFFESYPTPMPVLALLTKKGHLVIAHPGTPDVSLQRKMSKGNQSVWRLVIWLVWRLTIGKPKERATSKRRLRNGLIQIRQPLVVPPSTTSPKGSESAVPVSGPVWIYQEKHSA